MKFTVLGLMLLFLACNGQKKTAMDSDKEEGQHPDDRLSLVISDNYSGSDEAETLIIRDAKSLQKFYSKINRTRKPGLPLPDIDFSKEMIVIQCSGKQTNASVPRLYVMEESGEEFVIGVRETDEKQSSTAVTTPFSVYKMALTEKEVVVREK